MSTEKDVKQQLAEYFGWLEGHVGSDLRRTGAPTPVGSPNRTARVLSLVGVAALIAVVTIGVTRDEPSRVGPASTVEQPNPASTILPTTGAPTTVAVTSPSAAMTWAPIDLPEGMRVVDVSWGFELAGGNVPLAEQNFAGVSVNSARLTGSLSVVISETDLSPPEISNAQVHGLPISLAVDSTAGTVAGWWIEHGLRIEFLAVGRTAEEVTQIFDESTWRSDPTRGLEPDSISGGLSLLYEIVGTRPFTRFVVETESGFVTVEANGRATSLPFAAAEPVGDGRLLDTSFGSVLLTDDGSALTISPTLLKESATEVPDDALVIAQSIAHVDADAVTSLKAEASRRVLDLPFVGRVRVGDYEVTLQGGTAQLPEALCVLILLERIESCTFNSLVSSGNRGWSIEWLSVGDDFLFVTYRVAAMDPAIARVCLSDANGVVGVELPYDETVDGDRAWTVTRIPAGEDYAVMCGSNNPIDGLPSSSFQTVVQRPGT